MPNHEILRVEDGRHAIRCLWRGQVHLRLARSLEPADPHVADDADDGPRSIEMTERLADGILTRPVALGEGCADDRNPDTIAGVRVLDVATLTQRNPHRLEILWR